MLLGQGCPNQFMQIPNVSTPDEVEKEPPSLFLNNEPITVMPARASRGGDF